MKVAVLNVATGKYIDFFDQLKESIEKNFFNEAEVDIFLFTDSNREYKDNVKKVKIQRGGWPKDTLYRYHYFLLAKEELAKYDFLFYIDVDMKIVGNVGNEIVGDLMATLHPGFYEKNNASFERRRQSTAFVSEEITAPYYCGGVQGGRPKHFLKACEKIVENINEDEKKNIVALWHDESHWNKYLTKNKPDKVLSPSYCYPTDCYFPWLDKFSKNPKIITIEKDEEGLKKEMTAEESYKDYLRGKKVVLVGPSKTLMNSNKGEFIDSFDVVVRLNNMLDIIEDNKEHVGSRTDVLYAVLDDPPKKIAFDSVKHKVKYLSSSYPESEWFFKERMSNNVKTLRMVKRFKTVTLPAEPYFSVKRINKTRPNTGFSAIIDLVSSDLEELHIIGMDFYRSIALDGEYSYISGYETQWKQKSKKSFLKIEYDGNDCHDPDNDFTYFKRNIYEKDDRISVGEHLKKFLEDKKFEKISNLL